MPRTGEEKGWPARGQLNGSRASDGGVSRGNTIRGNKTERL